MFLVYITCKNESEAKKIAEHLLGKRLIGCANIVPKINSLYWWRGKIQSDKESLMLGKTSKKNISSIKREVKKVHSYNVPCIEFLKIADQNEEYAKWLKKELK